MSGELRQVLDDVGQAAFVIAIVPWWLTTTVTARAIGAITAPLGNRELLLWRDIDPGAPEPRAELAA